MTLIESGALHYAAAGKGQALIALHGFGATSYAWRFLAPELARDHEVFLVDLKGHGKSPRPARGGYSLDDQAELVGDLIRKRNLRDVVLMGNSLGGGVALTLALQLAAQGSGIISHLILLDSIYKASVPSAFKVLRTPGLGRLAMALPARMAVWLTLRYVMSAASAVTRDAVEQYAVNLTLKGGKHALLECVRQIDIHEVDDTVDKVRKLDLPSLILWGADDPLFAVEVGKRLNGDLRNSEFHIMPQCGHLPQEEQPQMVLKYVREFLEGRQDRGQRV